MAKSISCSKHGTKTSAVVCRHHLDIRDREVGFVENSSDPDDLQAWCDLCEAKFLEEGDKTDAFLAFNRFAVVCIECYARLKRQHTGQLS